MAQLSLGGAALTVASMFFLNALFAALTVAIAVAIYTYVSLRFDSSAWPGHGGMRRRMT